MEELTNKMEGTNISVSKSCDFCGDRLPPTWQKDTCKFKQCLSDYHVCNRCSDDPRAAENICFRHNTPQIYAYGRMDYYMLN